MAITWRNIGQSANAGNSLISAGSDTVAGGLNTLRGVAQEVTNNEITQFNKQAEVNTADLLNRIQTSDEGGLGGFDIRKLKEQYGNAFNANAITQGLGDRTEQLRGIAREQSQEARLAAQDNRAEEQLKLSRQAATLDNLRTRSSIALNEQNLNISQTEQAELGNYSDANNTLLDNLGSYGSINDVEQSALLEAKKRKLNPTNTAALVSSATNMWNTAIEPSADDLAPINNLAANAAQVNMETAKVARQNLDDNFRSQGFEPIYLDLANTKDGRSLEEVQGKLLKQYDADEVNKFAPFFEEVLKRAPNGEEAAYFIPLAYETNFITSNGLDINDSDFKKKLETYRDTLSNNKAVDTYRQAKQKINLGERSFGEKAQKQLTDIKKRMRDENRRMLGADRYDVDPRSNSKPKDVDFTKFISKDLYDKNWLNPSSKPKATQAFDPDPR